MPTLNRTLGRWELTLIGVSNAVGAGVLVLAGTMAASYAGPAAALSFGVAGLVCLLVALCYAELAAMMPDAGSAYSYTKASLGRLASWLVGWCLVLGYLVAGATVAVGWSGYFAALLQTFGLHIPNAILNSPLRVSADLSLVPTGAILNLPAVLIVLLTTGILVRGVRGSARINTVMVALKLSAILLFIVLGAVFVDTGNWRPFIPPADPETGRFGLGGIFAAAVLAFFAFTGFEVISTSTQEARQPTRDIPFALIASFCICALFYIATTLVMTGLAPFPELAHPSPITVAIDAAGPQLGWLSVVVSALIVAGLPSAVLVSLYGQTRIFLVMSQDGLMPGLFGKIDPRSRIPVAGTIVVGAGAAAIAGVLPIEVLGELVSMGLLFCFAIVCVAVMVLRKRDPDAERPFRAPFYPATPLLGLASCVYLIFGLPVETWSRLAMWLLAGLAFYAVYGKMAARKPKS